MFVRAALIFVLLSGSAGAAGDQSYQNPRFGYWIEIPKEFKIASAADNNDGITLESLNGKAKLLVWGNYIMEKNFKAESDRQRKFYVDDGWRISYEKRRPSWVSFSGARDHLILYVREIALCDGAMGNFSLEYPEADQKIYGDVIEQLLKSFVPLGHC
ncbi:MULTISPECIES: hypothetical protein [Rhizobium]|uniref:Uncharacterized protein n=1 Tax=Rhizobium rhododendri TaxID=2506430 RepID=A0ABY8IQV9_9HYPH|nr:MULTISPECIES: hypothetical protein [Rhizobium]TQX85189.1 hypothetical protein EQW76_22450 [Rhizobium sp. rho-13.1]TQY09477.1 hypothetical protein EQW74_21655 [Rhizobium sp. rho-1.1]WFS25959.1 hypothetical protein PR018_20810 [Rhizobium rhododendri]